MRSVYPCSVLYLMAGLLCLQLLKGQEGKVIDSLKHQLRVTANDSARFRAWGNLAWEYAITRDKLDTARLYADSIRQLGIFKKDSAAQILAEFYYGVVCRFSSKFEEGLQHLNRYVAFYEATGDSLKLTAGLFQIAVIQQLTGNLSAALSNYLRLLKIYQSFNMSESVATTLHSIGHIQRKLGKPEEAIKSYLASITIKEQINDITGLSMSYESLGNTYGEMELYDQSAIYLRRALDFARDGNRAYGIASVTENLGNLYLAMGQYSKALDYHLEALKIRQELPSKKDLAESLNKVGSTYAKLGHTQKAEDYLLRSLALSRDMDAKPLIMSNYEALTGLNAAIGDYQKAFEYQSLYASLKDSIFNEQTLRQLHELETRYETEQKEHQIELLNREKELQLAKHRRQVLLRNLLVGILVLISLVAWLIVNTLRQRLKNQKLIAAKNEEIKITRLKEELGVLEMKALRSQMNPHFLFNCMNSINRMILSGDNDHASRYLTKFSKLVRLMLENSENPRVSLQDELEMLTAYIDLEAIRFKGKIDYTIKVNDEVDKENTFIPSMLLQPFVENAIWHGLMHLDKTGHLSISIHEKDNFLHCHIVDNGIGREASMKLTTHAKAKKKSLGIKLTEQRLRLLSQTKVKELIKIIDLKDEENRAAGTQVNILIPK